MDVTLAWDFELSGRIIHYFRNFFLKSRIPIEFVNFATAFLPFASLSEQIVLHKLGNSAGDSFSRATELLGQRGLMHVR